MEEDFAAKVMDVRVEKAKHDDDEDNAITANDANNAVATALRLMNMAVDARCWIDQTRPLKCSRSNLWGGGGCNFNSQNYLSLYPGRRGTCCQ